MRRLAIGALAVVAALASEARAADVPEVGRVLSVRGVAILRNADIATEFQLVRGSQVFAGDEIETGAGAAVRVRLTDRSIIDIGASSSLTLQPPAESRQKRLVNLRVVVGRVWARVSRLLGGESRFEVETGTAVAGIRGTELVVTASPELGTDIMVVEGSVEARSTLSGRTEMLGPMRRARVGSDGALVLGDVTTAEVEEARADTAPAAQLSASELKQLSELTGVDLRTEADPLELEGADVPGPPLESEPGVGNANLRGNIEVVEP